MAINTFDYARTELPFEEAVRLYLMECKFRTYHRRASESISAACVRFRTA